MGFLTASTDLFLTRARGRSKDANMMFDLRAQIPCPNALRSKWRR